MSAPRFEAWSWSRFNDWRRCPLFAKAKYIDKSIKDDSPAMARGQKIHEAAAAYLRGQTAELPKELERFGAQFRALVEHKPDMLIEQQWAFDDQWRMTGWFSRVPGKKAWLRVILDLAVAYPDETADLVDHKTGKAYDDNQEQVELFALAGFLHSPWLKKIKTRLWYLDSGDERTHEFTVEEKEPLRAKWAALAAPMMAETLWAPKPNEKCRWCPLARSAGGACKFG